MVLLTFIIISIQAYAKPQVGDYVVMSGAAAGLPMKSIDKIIEYNPSTNVYTSKVSVWANNKYGEGSYTGVDGATLPGIILSCKSGEKVAKNCESYGGTSVQINIGLGTYNACRMHHEQYAGGYNFTGSIYFGRVPFGILKTDFVTTSGLTMKTEVTDHSPCK